MQINVENCIKVFGSLWKNYFYSHISDPDTPQTAETETQSYQCHYCTEP